MTQPDVRAAAVEALREVTWNRFGGPEHLVGRFAELLLDALLASPERARAVVAALLTEETLAAALHVTGLRNHNLGEGPARAICANESSHQPRAAAILRALTQPDTWSEP